MECIAVWSPDGTVAYRSTSKFWRRKPNSNAIKIVDQQLGIIHCITNNRNNDFCDLTFSPDGRLLVSADCAGTVQLWNNLTGNYEKLQEWRQSIENFNESWIHIYISACSKYIAVYTSSGIVLKDIDKRGDTIRSLTHLKKITKVMHSIDCRAVFVCSQGNYSSVIKLWRPYLDDTDEDSLITLWEQRDRNYGSPTQKYVLSHDKTMIAIQYSCLNKGWLLSIGNNYSCLAQKLNFHRSEAPLLLRFTPADECIVYATNVGLKYWSVVEKKFTDKRYLLYNKKPIKKLGVVNCSPNSCQLIIEDGMEEEDALYIKSIL